MSENNQKKKELTETIAMIADSQSPMALEDDGVANFLEREKNEMKENGKKS